jgi:hypothetical protein
MFSFRGASGHMISKRDVQDSIKLQERSINIIFQHDNIYES